MKKHAHSSSVAEIDVDSIWLHGSQTKNQPHFNLLALGVVSGT